MSNHSVTLREVALEAGVGLATASRALGGDSRCAPQTRERVLAAAKLLGYLPDPGVSALARRRIAGGVNRYTLVWLREGTGSLRLDDLKLFEKVKDQVVKRGYNLSVACIPELGGPVATGRVLFARGVVGCFVTTLTDPEVVKTFPWERFSVVSYLQENFELPFDTVRPDMFSMMFHAWRRARASGAQRIGVVIPSSTIALENELLLSACAYHQRELAESPPVLILQPDAFGGVEHYTALTTEWFARYRPQVVIGKTEGALWSLKQAGWQCPADYRFMTLRRTGTDGAHAGFNWEWNLLAEALAERMHALVSMGARGPREAPGTWIIPSRWSEAGV